MLKCAADDFAAEMRNVDAAPEHLRLFAKGPLQVADAEHAKLPLHVQQPPVPHLSWSVADEIVALASFPAEERMWLTLSHFYRSTSAADWLWDNRDSSLDIDADKGSALLDGDIQVLLNAQFAKLVGLCSDLPAGISVNCFVFTVLELLKGRRRIIAWPRATNVAERRVLDMLKAAHCVVPFPKANTLRMRVVKKYAAHVDLTKFFQQFELLTRKRFYFAHDGNAYELTTIPTGAVAPPIMAQILLRACVSLAIRRANATSCVVFDTMIDNARLCSDDWDALSASWTELMKIFEWLGSTVGEALQPAHSTGCYEFLGIAFDHVSRSVALSEKFRVKLAKAATLLQQTRSLVIADILSIFGACVWAAQVLALPLAELYAILKFVRRVSSALASGAKLTDTRDVWPSITDHWVQWMTSAMVSNVTITVSQLSSPRLIAFTDASDSGWGVVIFDGDKTTILAGKWSEAERALHINEKEFLTIKKMLLTYECDTSQTVCGVRVMDLFVDNTTAGAWAGTANPRNYVMSQIKQDIEQLKIAAHIIVENVAYVASLANPSDIMSRLTW